MMNAADIKDIGLRSSFLSERLFPPQQSLENTDHKNSFSFIRKKLKALPPVALNYLADMERSLDCVSEDSHHGRVPEWYNFISGAFEKPLVRPYNASVPEVFVFAEIFHPLIVTFETQARDFLAKQAVKYEEAMLKGVGSSLLKEFVEIGGLTLYCQIKDECPELSVALYKDWCKNYAAKRWPETLKEYPLLGRILHQRYIHFFDCFQETILRFKNDKNRLLDNGFITSGGAALAGLDVGLSDRHNNARSVCRLNFSDGASLIYKPKSLKNEVWLQNFLSKCDTEEFDSIGRYKVMDCGDYGWAENIFNRTVVEKESKMNIETRYSQVSALAYCMNATDLHFENIAIIGEKIYIIDLETIFTYSPFNADGDNDHHWDNYTILSTHLFDDEVERKLKGQQGALDSIMPSIKPPYPFYDFLPCPNEGVRIIISGEKGGKVALEASVLNFSEKMDVANFKTGFEDFGLKCQKLLGREQPEEIGELKCRFVARPTIFYSRLFQRLYHPRMLKDGALFSLELIDLMATLHMKKSASKQRSAPLIMEEIRQLENGDYPYFYYYPESKAVFSTNGQVHKDFFSLSPLAFFQHKNEHFQLSDFQEQAEIVEGKILAGRLGDVQQDVFYNAADAVADMRGDILDLTEKLAADIMTAARKRQGKMTRWIGFEPDAASNTLAPVFGDQGFYTGYWGIVTFLTAAEENLKLHDRENSNLHGFLQAEAAYWADQDFSDIFKNKMLGYSGVAGMIKAWSIMASTNPQMWGFLGDRILPALKKVSLNLSSKKELYDHMMGGCGLLSVLIDCQNRWQNTPGFATDVIPCIQKLSRKILSNLEQVLIDKFDQGEDLVGLAHGNGGVILTLVRMAEHGDIKIQKIIRHLEEILNYDDSCKIEGSGLWRDNRNTLGQNTPVSRGWCHGLAGIGISRLAVRKIQDFTDRADADLQSIVDKIHSEASKQQYDCFCCGEAGEIDFLIEANDVVGGKNLPLIKTRSRSLMQAIQNNKSFAGLFGETDPQKFPGLFQGVGGIGYVMLRLIDDRLPSLSW